MKQKQNYLKLLDLPQEVKEGIESRSSMLCATLKTISKEDLIQEGIMLVYEIMAKKPDAPILYLMKALNNHYADIQASEVEYKVSARSLESDNVERELDTIAFREYQKRPRARKREIPRDNLLSGEGRGQVEPIILMKERGHSFKEIAEYLGKDPKTIRRLLKQHGKSDL